MNESTKGTKGSHDTTVRRAALPQIMFPADISLVLELTEEEATFAAGQGLLGPQIFVKGRPAVLREDFLEFLTLRAASKKRADKEVLRA